MIEINLFIPGEPMTAGSKIAGVSKAGKRFCRPASKFTRAWMDTVRKFASEKYKGPLLTGPIAISEVFLFVRPKSHYGTGRNSGNLRKSAPKIPLCKDLGKLERALEDALTGIIYRDDSQISRRFEPYGKAYCPSIVPERSGVYVKIIED